MPRLDAFQIQVAGAAAACSLLIAGGWTVAANVATTPTTATATRTVHRTSVVVHTHNVTVHVRGRVIRRHGATLIVYIPRTVFRTKGDGHKRIVIPAHVVRIRQHHPAVGPVTSLIVPPLPVTVTVPVTVVVPGPTTTVTAPPVTVTEPAVTVTGPTITVTLPAASGP